MKPLKHTKEHVNYSVDEVLDIFANHEGADDLINFVDDFNKGHFSVEGRSIDLYRYPKFPMTYGEALNKAKAIYPKVEKDWKHSDLLPQVTNFEQLVKCVDYISWEGEVESEYVSPDITVALSILCGKEFHPRLLGTLLEREVLTPADLAKLVAPRWRNNTTMLIQAMSGAILALTEPEDESEDTE